MAAAAAPASIHPRTVEDIFKDFSARRAALIRALTTDVDRFYLDCDPEKDNLSLYAHPNGTWEVALPAEEVPPEVPEPALGINFARDGMNRREWLSLVAMHADTWLLAIAFYFGAHLNRNDRKRLFTMMNDMPNVYEVVTERNPSKDKPGVDSGNMAKPGTKRPSEGHLKRNVKRQAVTYEEEDDEEEDEVEEEEEEDDDGGDDDDHGETLCGSCGGLYNADEFWICCDMCEKWFHGKCVKITPARAEHIKHYKCPSCSIKKGR